MKTMNIAETEAGSREDLSEQQTGSRVSACGRTGEGSLRLG